MNRIGRYSRRRLLFGIALFCTTLMLGSAAASAADWKFRLTFAESVHDKPYTGRVYLIFSRLNAEPRQGPSWFEPELFVARDVVDWKPGETLEIDAATEKLLAYPEPLGEMSLSGYRAQAVVRFNPWEREIGEGPGNGFSTVVTLPQEAADEPIEFVVDQLVPQRKFRESKWCKLLTVKSKLLGEFYGHEVTINAAVLLPASYNEMPERRYPTIYTIPGFGGTHFDGQRNEPIAERNAEGVEFIRVLLDPSCPLGHHVFADSENNGPWGTALVEEFIPEFERQYRGVADPHARFLTGHSSGGWSSLWLQVAYPDQFGGVWSTAPDPVDFRDFQRIDLYRQGENMYVDGDGNRRPLARNGENVLLWYRGFADMEWVLGPGGQLHSFEAVFSHRGQDGKPELLWNRDSGEIDADVAKSWERYDIRLILERNWETLGPKLKGKLHVIMGDEDTFYLEGATRLLMESLEQLGSDAGVELVPGKNHFNLLSADLRNRIRREMVAAYLKHRQ